MGKVDTSKLVKLDEAARQLGCHVQTLRVRIRSGSLEAVRGPHGAYYIAPSALKKLRGIRHVRPPGEVTPEIIERSWAVIEDTVDIGTRTLLRVVHRNPGRDVAVYRLVSVHRLAAVGLSFKQIAGELGVSAYHARRLYRRSLVVELAKWARRRSTRRVSTRQARELLADLRTGLEAEGHQRHLRVRLRRHGGQARTTAFTVRNLDRRAITWLRTRGLSEDEIDAIMQLGIGEDELHALILKAIDSEQREREIGADGMSTAQ
jgi:transposase